MFLSIGASPICRHSCSLETTNMHIFSAIITFMVPKCPQLALEHSRVVHAVQIISPGSFLDGIWVV